MVDGNGDGGFGIDLIEAVVLHFSAKVDPGVDYIGVVLAVSTELGLPL